MASPHASSSSTPLNFCTRRNGSDDDLVDITHLVEECAASMTVEDPFLCNPRCFSLHDAMAASQLTDSKMDCCEIPVTLVAPYGKEIVDKDRMVFPRPAPVGLDGPFTPLLWDTLTTSDAAFVTIHMLIRLQSLFSGASVGESTFTCLYAHSSVLADMRSRLFPERNTDGASAGLTEQMEQLAIKGHEQQQQHLSGTLAQIVVFASALALVETTEMIRGLIYNADIYEEEDFVSNTNNIAFYTEDHDDANALQALEMALHATKKAQQPESSSCDLLKAVELLIDFQSGFLSAVKLLAKLRTGSVPLVVKKAKAILMKTGESVASLLALLDRLVDTEGSSESVKATLHQSFDSYVNRPLVGNAPVRKFFFQEPKQALTDLHILVTQLDWAVCDFILEGGSSLGRIQRMLDRVTRSDVNIVCRSHIILNLYFLEKILGQYDLQQLIVNDMKQWAPVPDAFFTSEHALAFLNRLAKPIYDTLKLRTLNKHRQRAYIEAVMLPEWASLQNEAHLVDVHYRQENQQDATTPPYFSQYVLTIVIRLMERYVASGIALGLFHNHEEITCAYWYRDFLLSALLSNLTMMKGAKVEKQQEVASTHNISPANKRGKKKKNQKSKSSNGSGSSQVRVTEEDKQDELELTILTLKRNLCRGTIRFMAALRQAGILKDCVYEFTSMERIFSTRYEAFEQILQPPVLTYEHYMEGSDFSNVPPGDLLQSTADWFQSCKRTVDVLLVAATTMNTSFASMQEQEMRSLLKVCIGNSIFVHRLQQFVQDPERTKKDITVDFDFSSHPEFCMIKLS